MSSSSPSFNGYSAVQLLSADPVTTLYSAVHDGVGRKVVIKTLSSGILPDSPFAQNLEREATILASLNHPNIVGLYDFQRTAGVPWLAREWVDGWSLAHILQRLKRCSPLLAASIATQVASALAHAHDCGIIHRTVTPDCVLINKNGAVKLTGFSAASGKRAPRIPELIEAQAGLSPPSYLSPENELGEPASPGSDVFAVGVMLYQMLVGELPPSHNSVGGALLKTRTSAAPTTPLRQTAAPLPLQHLTLRCIAKETTERFGSGALLHQALLATMAGYGESNAQTATLTELQRARMITDGAAVPSLRPHAASGRVDLQRRLRQAAIALGFLSLLLLAFFMILRLGGGGNSVPTSTSNRNLAQVRVVVQPWAHVYVDGQYVDDTPFAEAILLPAGTHLFRFEHPKAPTEQRQVSVVLGEAIQLDIRMNVPIRPILDPSRAKAATSAPEPGP